ncbi:MAG: hypothetical protein ABSB13_11870, partial [Candidatus Binatus sp.]
MLATSAAISLSHADRRKKKGFPPRNADPRQFQLDATLNRSFVTILPDDVIASSIFKGDRNMSNHFTGLSLGPPLGKLCTGCCAEVTDRSDHEDWVQRSGIEGRMAPRWSAPRLV